MRTPIILTAVTAALAAAPALAETAFDGPYVGAVAGVQLHSANRAITTGTDSFRSLAPANTPFFLDLNDNDGWHGGILAGWNFSSGALVYGIEADFSIGNIKGTSSFSGAPIPGLAPAGVTTTANRRIGNRGSVRARLGTTLGEKALVYVTGGLAGGDTRASASVIVNGAGGLNWTGESEDTRFGWTVGGGAEFKLTEKVGLRAEYLYTDLGRQPVFAAGNTAVRGVAALTGIDYAVSAPNRGGVARVGFTYKF
jgi:outer membrane immunogenic protein